MCEICGHTPCLPGCPNYSVPKSKLTGRICCQCGEEIIEGEQFIINQDNEAVHYECADDTNWLVRWLGGEIYNEEGALLCD